jgi:hypothetical protein
MTVLTIYRSQPIINRGKTMAQHMKPPPGGDHYAQAMRPDSNSAKVAEAARTLGTPAPKVNRSTVGTATGETRNSPLTGSKPRATGKGH